MLCFSFRFSISGIAFCKRGVIFPCLQKQYFFSLFLAILSPGKLLFIRLSVLLFLFTSYCPMIFFLSQREDVFSLPVKTQKKICSGRSFGNIKIFQPGNWKGFFTMQVTARRSTKNLLCYLNKIIKKKEQQVSEVNTLTSATCCGLLSVLVRKQVLENSLFSIDCLLIGTPSLWFSFLRIKLYFVNRGCFCLIYWNIILSFLPVITI